MFARSKAHRDYLDNKAAEAEAAAEAAAEEEEEGEEEGEEGEESEGEGEEEEEEEEIDPERPWPLPEQAELAKMENGYFLHNEKLREKFNEVELDTFMKLLNVKPIRQWQDNTVHHYKLGVHTYEDDS